MSYPILLIGLIFFSYQFSVVNYAHKMLVHNKDYFKRNYLDASPISFTTLNPKSLVLIYVESLEDTYSNKQIFGKDLLHSLNLLKKDGVSFDGYLQMPGTQWTTAVWLPLNALSL